MPEAAPSTVLLVDDDEVMRQVLSLVLGMAGYTVLTAQSGDEALQQLAQTAPGAMPDCVLTDMKMPGLCGFPLGERLRAALPATSVRLAMSGSGLHAAPGTAFDGFLLKPFGIDDFTTAFTAARASRTPAASPAASQASTTAQVLDRAVYAKLQASMSAEQLAALYALCLDDAARRIARMRAAVTVGDGDAYGREAHALKGSCGMLGAAEMQALAARMETGAHLGNLPLDDFTAASERLRRMLCDI